MLDIEMRDIEWVKRHVSKEDEVSGITANIRGLASEDYLVRPVYARDPFHVGRDINGKATASSASTASGLSKRTLMAGEDTIAPRAWVAQAGPME